MKKFSTFEGVFIPTIMSIIGVVIFLRAGFVVGHAGIYQALAVLIIAKMITTITGLSISAIATNTEVKGGGTYYLISRSMGPEFGGAIALTIFISQSLAIPFYLIGLADAMVLTFPALDLYYDIIAYAVFALTAFIAFKGASNALKAQFVIMIIVLLSIAAFMIGAAMKWTPETFAANTQPLMGSKFPFWILFAIYFPAVTGILSGVNMSGDLKNPTRSIPLGMLTAIFISFLIYAAQMLLMGGALSREELTDRPYYSLLGIWTPFTTVLVAIGVLVSALSSALATILGAPRVLQSLGQDKLLKPVNMFAKVTSDGEPRRALVLTLIIGFATIYFATRGGSGGGALNMVASVVSMFFLWTYGIINLAAFVESFSRNPSFRPRFKFFHWFAALVGALASFGATLLINITASLIAGAVFVGLYYYVRKYGKSAQFSDARRGFVYSRTRENLLALSALPLHAKNWRPTAVAFVGNLDHRLHLIKYANWLSSGRGILTITSMVKGNITEMTETRNELIDSLNNLLNKNRVEAFSEVIVTPDFNAGVNHFLQAHSIGPIKSNLALYGWSSDPSRAQAFMDSILAAASLNMSVGLIYGKELPNPNIKRKDYRIDIWWRGMRNGSLMVILAYLLSLNSEWAGAKIRIIRVANTPSEVNSAKKELEGLIEAARMPNVIIEPILSNDSFPNLLLRHSGESTVVFLGFSMDTDTDPARFQAAYTSLLRSMPTTIMIQSTGEADLLS